LVVSALLARSFARYCAFESGVPALAAATPITAAQATRASPANNLNADPLEQT
jgi:hypothetical protein